MGSLASEVLDEAHCFWATCAHPCCWESEQRIAKGVPHYIKPRTSDGGRAPVDASHKSSSGSITQAQHSSDQSVGQLFQCIMGLWLPSDVGTQSPTHPAVPSPKQELICLPSLKTSKINRNPRIEVQESKNVRKRVPFQLTTLTSKPRSEHGLSSPVAQQTVHPTDLALAKPDTDTDPKREEEEAQSQAHTSPHPPPAARIPSAFLLRNKPVVFHSVRERVLRRHTQQDLSTYKYKLDSKTGGGGIDWDSLRRQTYLWRKHNLPPREKPFPPEDMTVSQIGFGFYPIPKAMLHHDPRSPLSKGPAVWRCLECVDGMWCGHGGGPLASISKCLNSLVSNSSFKFCSRSNLSCQNPLHQLLDGDYLSDVDPGNKGTIAPQNSMMYLQDTASNYSDCQGEDNEFGLCPERDAEGGLGSLERPGRSS
nr:uncharacterized protein LOC115111003 isoform X3 [Oncorhynchus nerka]